MKAMSPLHRPDLPAYVLAAIALVCITLLVALHDTVPQVLADIAILGAGGGVALRSTTQRNTDTTTKGR
jgi:hypothetical protein